MMRDLPCGVTESHSRVERGGSEPNRFSPALLIPAPESHMMTLARAVSHWLLEREILFAFEKKQITHRRLLIGAPQYRRNSDTHTGAKSQCIGGIPFRGNHGTNHVLL